MHLTFLKACTSITTSSQASPHRELYGLAAFLWSTFAGALPTWAPFTHFMELHQGSCGHFLTHYNTMSRHIRHVTKLKYGVHIIFCQYVSADPVVDGNLLCLLQLTSSHNSPTIRASSTHPPPQSPGNTFTCWISSSIIFLCTVSIVITCPM
jgi:hypothetical protein